MTILTPKGYTPGRQPNSEKPESPAAPPASEEQTRIDPAQVMEGAGQQIELTFPPQVVGINCPSCGTPYPAQVFNIVDVGQDPVLKSVILSGQLNVAICPNCRTGGSIATSLLYHDPAHEFLGVYVPEQVAISEQQKTIGDLSRRLMDRLPQEARRGYMLNPRQFLSYQSLLEAILENEGVTKEMLERQRSQIALLQDAMTALSDPEGLRLLAQERDEDMDDQFFALLQRVAESTAAAGEEEEARQLLALRERLVELTTWGKGVQKQRAAIAQLKPDTTVEELVQIVISADDERVVDALILAARPLVNYQFYQILTQQIESATNQDNTAEAERLSKLREHILAFSKQLDEVERASVQQYSQVLSTILASDDIERAVRESAAYIDQNFLAVLMANLQEAERQGATAAVRRLQEVWEAAMALVEEQAPPELQLINKLLAADGSNATRRILSENREQVTAEFIEALSSLIEDMSDQDSAELVARLKQIRSQAQLML